MVITESRRNIISKASIIDETKYNIQDLFLQIKVIGQRGDGDKSDLALDAFKILQGHCSEYQYYDGEIFRFFRSCESFRLPIAIGILQLSCVVHHALTIYIYLKTTRILPFLV